MSASSDGRPPTAPRPRLRKSEGCNEMSFEYDQGDKFWTKRMPFAGQIPAFASAQELYEAASEAFSWLHDHPLREEVLFHNKGAVVRTFTTRPRAFTWRGVALCMGISDAAFVHYRKNEEFKPVVDWIESVIHTQKFQGAAVGIFNPNFIARDLGMADRSEVTGKDGGPLATQDVTEEKLLDEAKRLGIPLEHFGIGNSEEEGGGAGA